MSRDAITLWTGGGLVAVGAVVSALVTNLLGARRDRRRYAHEQEAARAARRHEQEMAREAHSHEQDMAQGTRDHEQDMAREARRQERLAQTYIELLTYLSRYLDWSRSVRPMLGPVPAPDPPPSQERWRIEALVMAYGSQKVRRLLDEWGECATKIDDADAMLRLLEQSKNPSKEFEDKAMGEHRALPEYKQAMFEADKAIRYRVYRELAGEV
jgi:hypothetical protein